MVSLRHIPASPIQPPPALFRLYERGELTREELHAAMAVHARSLIVEMEEGIRNPVGAYVENLRNRAAARRLIRRHGEAAVREVLSALAETPGFEPANLLWNVCHWDVPLHCFLRARHDPVFRVNRLDTGPLAAEVSIEHGRARSGKLTREKFTLRRNWFGNLEVESRTPW